MVALSRVKERIETDLSDAEIQAMIDGAAADIDLRFGPNAELTVIVGDDRDLDGGGRFLDLPRPIDEALSITIVEIDPPNQGGLAAKTTLQADDYRILHRGRSVERLIDGTNGRARWAPLVEVTYTPVSDSKQRDEVIIQIVQLEAQARGLSGERAGDWQASYPDLVEAREKLINSLSPRRGLIVA
jgi:hypothetical protein